MPAINLFRSISSVLSYGEKRAAPSVPVDNTAGLARIFNWGGNSIHVTEETALKISTVYACVRVLTEGIASLPHHVYRKVDGGKEIATDHPLYNLIHSEPNPLMTAFTFDEVTLGSAILWGNGYALIERDPISYRPKALWPLMPWETDPLIIDRKLFYQTKYGLIPDYDIYHLKGLGFDGVKGKSPIKLQAEQLGITLGAQKYGADLFKKGTTTGGLLTTEKDLKDGQQEQIKKWWNEDTVGPDANHNTKVMGSGMKFQRITLAPEEAQFLQTRQMGSTDICAMFRVPPHMVANLDRSTNNNIEHQGIDFVKYSLMPWITRIEQEKNRKLFQESEKGKIQTGFNVAGLLRGDLTAQTQHIKDMQDRGNYTINQALAFLGQNTIGPEGDRRFVMRNMVPLDRVDETIKQDPKTNSNVEGKENN